MQLLAQSLSVAITAFFEAGHHKRRVLHQMAGKRNRIDFAQGPMEGLNEGIPRSGDEPFTTRLAPVANNGSSPMVYPGREYICCLEGHITDIIEGEVYLLAPGERLIFDASTPPCLAKHCPHDFTCTVCTVPRGFL